MLTLLVSTTLLTALYGLVWHDQPARERERSEPFTRPKKTPEL